MLWWHFLLLGARLMPKQPGPALWPVDAEDGYADINDYACRLTSSGGHLFFRVGGVQNKLFRAVEDRRHQMAALVKLRVDELPSDLLEAAGVADDKEARASEAAALEPATQPMDVPTGAEQRPPSPPPFDLTCDFCQEEEMDEPDAFNFGGKFCCQGCVENPKREKESHRN